MLNSGIFFYHSCVVRKKNSKRNKKPYPPSSSFKLNGRYLRHEKRNNVPQNPTHKIKY